MLSYAVAGDDVRSIRKSSLQSIRCKYAVFAALATTYLAPSYAVAGDDVRSIRKSSLQYMQQACYSCGM
jgi:hypothetical protein